MQENSAPIHEYHFQNSNVGWGPLAQEVVFDGLQCQMQGNPLAKKKRKDNIILKLISSK